MNSHRYKRLDNINFDFLQLALTHTSYKVNYGTNPDHARNSLSNCGMRQLEYGDRKIHYVHTRKRGIMTASTFLTCSHYSLIQLLLIFCVHEISRNNDIFSESIILPILLLQFYALIWSCFVVEIVFDIFLWETII